MDKVAEALAPILDAGGPWTALGVGLVVGLGLLVIVMASTHGLFAKGRTEIQAVALQDRMLATIKAMGETEEALRDRLDQLEVENIQLRAELSLLRGQRFTLIEAVREFGAEKLRPPPIEGGA